MGTRDCKPCHRKSVLRVSALVVNGMYQALLQLKSAKLVHSTHLVPTNHPMIPVTTSFVGGVKKICLQIKVGNIYYNSLLPL